jgi:hypothetical protein
VSDIARRFIHRSLPRSGDGAVVDVVVVAATIDVPGSAASADADAVAAFAAAASFSASATLPFNRASSRASSAVDDAVSPLAVHPGGEMDASSYAPKSTPARAHA